MDELKYLQGIRKYFAMLLFIGCLGASGVLQAQGLEWAFNIRQAAGVKMAHDASNNLYVTGTFGSTNGDFDPGSATANPGNVGSNDVFVAKYNSTGQLVWVFGIGDNTTNQVNDIALDASGNIYLVGSFSNASFDFDPGAGTANATFNAGSDAYIAKYNNNGDFQWVKTIQGAGTEVIHAVQVDASNNIYVTGYFSGTADFDPGAGTVTLNSNNNGDDIFMAKYDASGNYQWATKIGGSGNERGLDLALDASNNVYITGYFAGTVDFDPGTGVASLTASSGIATFFAKYNSDGDYQWAYHINTISSNGLGIAIDNNNDVYITGFLGLGSNIDFDPGAGTVLLSNANFTADIFVAKYSSAGAYIWAFNIADGRGVDLVHDNSNHVYITGYFTGSNIDFDPGAGTTALTASQNDAFMAKYSSAGALQWAYNIGGTSAKFGQGISVDNQDNVYITGIMQGGTSDFDIGAGTTNLTTTGGEEDAYLAKYCQNGPGAAGTITGTATLCGGLTGVTYTIPVVERATGYTWSVPSGATIVSGDNTNSITVDFGSTASSGNITVTPTNGCGNGTISPNFAIAVTALAGSAGTISGTSVVCANQAGVIYTVPTIGNATEYIWSLPTGASITSGTNTNSITVTFGTTSGNITVQGKNSCGTGNVSTSFPVTVSASASPTANISANATTAYVGSRVVFTSTVTDEGSSPAYQWLVNGTAVSGATSATFTKNDLGNGDKVSLELTSSFSCATVAKVVSNEVVMNILSEQTPPSLAYAFNLENIYPRAITTDAAGNLYITGIFDGTRDFDPGAGVTNITATGVQAGFVAKYDANGAYQWAFALGSTTSAGGLDIKLDKHGNVHVTGSFGKTVDFDPGVGIANHTAQNTNHSDIFLAKYDNDGNYLWSKSMGGTLSEAGTDLEIDDAGNIYLAGNFESATIDMDPGTGTATLTNAKNATLNATTDLFVAKYDANGDYQWAFNIGKTAGESVNDIALDSEDNIYITGAFEGSDIDFDPGAGVAAMSGPGRQFYIAKYSSAGAYIWSYSFDDTGSNFGSGLVIDNQNNVYVTGSLGSGANADADPGPGVVSLTNQETSTQDAFVIKYAADGTYQWAFSIPECTRVSPTLDSDNNLFLVGNFTDDATSIDFDPSTSLATLSSQGGKDVFLAKYNTNGDYQWSKSIGNTNDDSGLALSIPVGSNALYILGLFKSTNIDTDLGAGTNMLNRLSSIEDSFIAKYQLAPGGAQTISGATSVCINATGVTYSIPAITGATSYTWTVPAGANISAGAGTNSITVIFGSAGGDITVKGINSVGDGVTTTLAVTVNPLVTPTVSISASATTICAGSPVTFTATATNGGTNPIFEWRLNGTKIDGETAATLTKSDLKNGDKITVVLTSSESCVTTSTATTNELTLIVNDVLTPAVSITSDDADNNIAEGTNVTFTATATNGGSNPTYQWQVNGVDVAGANAPSFVTATLQNSDKVTVVMTPSETCVTSTNVTSNEIVMSVGNVLTSIGGQLTNVVLSIYPNPSIEKASISIKGKALTHIQVDIFDALGRKADIQQGTLVNGTFELKVGHLAEGRYVLKIHLGNEVVTRSLVKQ
ncbi:MAG TPA: hypothetical protein DCS93_08035 [Microscillaceae bacterium]|nr:hypothetical protein [Microscillaceae bacterium]